MIFILPAKNSTILLILHISKFYYIQVLCTLYSLSRSGKWRVKNHNQQTVLKKSDCCCTRSKLVKNKLSDTLIHFWIIFQGLVLLKCLKYTLFRNKTDSEKTVIWPFLDKFLPYVYSSFPNLKFRWSFWGA